MRKPQHFSLAPCFYLENMSLLWLCERLGQGIQEGGCCQVGESSRRASAGANPLLAFCWKPSKQGAMDLGLGTYLYRKMKTAQLSEMGL